MSHDITTLSGIGPSRAEILRGMGIHTLADLLRHLPRDYQDRSQPRTVDMLVPGQLNTLWGTVAGEAENAGFRPGRHVRTRLPVQDEQGGRLEMLWFGRPYLKKFFKKDQQFLFTGKVTEGLGPRRPLQMESPEYEPLAAPGAGPGIVPLYTLPKGLSQKLFRGWMRAALARLPEASEALRNIHFPESDAHFHAARRQLVFEELFAMQLKLLQLKGARPAGIPIPPADLAPFTENLPFALTPAQQTVLDELAHDLQSARRMSRLLQGDVGSGKTVVAAAAAYGVLAAGYQAVLMAPTEILARQHFRKFVEYLAPLGFETVLLVGGLPAKEKRAAIEALREGRAHMAVGTHALIQEGVAFRRPGLVITDEQHRFGVQQRSALSEASAGEAAPPHILVMTATPIPRTLGLILYGDMDISVIEALPPGRLPIQTYCVNSGYRARLHAFMAKQVQEGRQVYVICPSIEEAENTADVKSYSAALQTALPQIPVACLHGRLPPAEKDAVMAAFARNEIAIIVSTTVIEVGVDVPNATLMVVENADRFGLSQLHQLRGRVGRGASQSYCVLVTDTQNAHTLSRMRALERTSDGFALSELDLQLRGPGDFFGVQQHGLPALRIANLYRDRDILKEAQAAALAAYEGEGTDCALPQL